MKKRVFALFVSAMMCAGVFAGCSSKTEPAPSTDAKTETTTPDSSADANGGDAATTAVDYPTKPVQVLIPYAPGGGSDILTRAIMQYIKLPNDQPLVAINTEGASGMTGAMEVYHGGNDGYEILAHNPMDVVSYTLSGATNDEIWREMEMICCVVDDFNVISTNKQSGWTSIDEVIEYAKAHPGEIKWGVTGAQTVNMADTVRVVEALGLKDFVTLVPYDGGSASKTALMGNHIQMETNSSSDIRTSIESGDTIPLMVIGDRKANALPDVQTTKEYGIDVVTTKPRGYYAPAGTPQEIIDILASAMEEVCKSDEFAQRVSELGLEVNFVRGEEMQPKIEAWVEDLKPVFETLNQ